MKLTPTVVVVCGAFVCAGALLLAFLTLALSPGQIEFLFALMLVLIGLFLIQIGYVHHVRDTLRSDWEKRGPPGDSRE